MFTHPLLKFLFSKPQPPDSLESELDDLRHNYQRTSEHLAALSQDFFANGGICCPGCGVPGYRDLEEKNERRWKRMREVEKKIASRAAKR